MGLWMEAMSTDTLRYGYLRGVHACARSGGNWAVAWGLHTSTQPSKVALVEDGESASRFQNGQRLGRGNKDAELVENAIRS